MAEDQISVLFNLEWVWGLASDGEPPVHFGDLNLDQVVGGVVGRRSSYELASFFHLPLDDLEQIGLRQEVFRDLYSSEIFDPVERFSKDMQLCAAFLERSKKLYNARQKQRWFLDAAGLYSDAVSELAGSLSQLPLKSKLLGIFVEYLESYVASTEFSTLMGEAKELQSRFVRIRYNLLIKANKITVTGYDGEDDFSEEVEKTFSRFRQGIGKDYRVNYGAWPDMNRVEEEILEMVVRLNPEVFEALSRFCISHSGFTDETISRFDREVQFYLAYIEQIKELEKVGLEFCYPVLSKDKKEFHITGGFDLALAQRLVKDGKAAVRNDYSLFSSERVIVVSGPNSGGKTTYARAFGQINYLASLGCPVPAKKAELFLCDQILTHFEREEDLDNLRGKLEDELVRIHRILSAATERSLIIMNESFGSTALGDATLLGRSVLNQIIDLGATCLCVTFVDELSRLSDATVSIVAKVSPEDPTIRTFEMEQRPADGLAYAFAIAEKYRLTYENVRGRIAE